MADTWHWRFENVDGSTHAASPSSAFPTQGDAESWLGEHWRSLLDDGVEQVTLLEDEREVYGPMGLRPQA